jgi:hypothetical protein
MALTHVDIGSCGCRLRALAVGFEGFSTPR